MTNSVPHPLLIIDRNPILFCKCGNKPYISAEFYYKSKYNTEPTIGTIAKIYSSFIISTNGTKYAKYEIEVKPKHIAREEKLNDLGI